MMLTNLVDYISSSRASAVTEFIAWLIVHSTWQFAAIGLLAWAAGNLCSRSAATVRYTVMSAFLTIAAATPVATALLLPGVMPHTVPAQTVTSAPADATPHSDAAPAVGQENIQLDGTAPENNTASSAVAPAEAIAASSS